MKPWSEDWLIAAEAYPVFYSMKRLEVFLLPLDGTLVHRRSLPPPQFVRIPQQFAGTHLYTQVVQKLDNAIHRINHYPVDSVVCFVNTYPMDSDLSGGQRYPAFEQPGPGRREAL